MSETLSKQTQRTQKHLDVQQVWDALQEVPDPELPAISVIDMGIVRQINVDEQESQIYVEITPTFAGCPAINQIQESIKQHLAPMARQIEVRVTMRDPWTSNHLSAEAHEKLQKAGIAPPARIAQASLPMLTQQSLTCPHCGSQQTILENAFGPTPCRAIAYCNQCHQPFEQFKPI